MKPYYTDAYCTIYHGRAEVVVPSLEPAMFDLLLTDPPYGIGEARGKNKSRTNIAVARDYGNAKWDDVPPAPWLIEMLRARSTHQIIFGGNYLVLPPSSCWLVWDKDNGEKRFRRLRTGVDEPQEGGPAAQVSVGRDASREAGRRA